MPVFRPSPSSKVPHEAIPSMSESWDFTSLAKPTVIAGQQWPATTRPLVTIRCAAFNHERFIRDAFQGFLSQRTTFPVQIVVNDDASSDQTPSILEGYATRFPSLVWLVLQPQNLYSRRLWPKLEPLCLGRYVALCEGDDYWTDPDKLQKQVSCLESDSSVSVCYHDSFCVDEYGRRLPGNLLWHDDRRDATDAEMQRAFTAKTATMVYRNCLGVMPPEFALAFGKDKFLRSMLGHHGRGRYLTDISPSAYRIHGGGVETGQRDWKRSKVNHARTAVALFLYYDRMGHGELRDFFGMRASRLFGELYGVSWTQLLRAQWRRVRSMVGGDR